MALTRRGLLERIGQVGGVGAAYMAAERVVLDALSEPEPSVARLREARAEMAARIKGLQAQVSRAKR